MRARRDSAPSRPLLAPDLMARVRQIQIRTHRLVSSALQGAYRSNFRGAGIEFEEVRPYLPGDEVRSIDWNVTARTGAPHIKTYSEDRQLILQFLVDTSRSMDFGCGEKSKREAAAEVCALLSFVAAAQQDQVGLTLFAAECGLHLAPDRGHRHVLRVVREVMAAPAGGAGSSLTAVLEHQLRRLKRRALVFLVSDFLGAADEPWDGVLGRLARRHDVIAVRVYDPLEEELPPAGMLLLEDLESGRTLEVDTDSARVRAAWRDAAAARRAALLATLRRAQVDLVDVGTTEDVADPLRRLFHLRARRGGRGSG
ncbi:MAG: DUF58 domain-containing protein [Planctomycetota bacterium]